MPCRVTTNCSLCGQEMSGDYPQGIVKAVAALVKDHNELKKCHREIEEQEAEEQTWRQRHDDVVDQRNDLKREILAMRAAGALRPGEVKSQALADASVADLLNEIAKRTN